MQMPAYGLRIIPVYFAREDTAVIPIFIAHRSVLKVYEHGSGVGLVVCISVICHVWCRRQLCLHTRLVEVHGIVTRSGCLRRLVERATIVLSILTSSNGHYEHIAKVHPPRAIEMILAETPYFLIAVDIFCTVVPTYGAGNRRGLY